MNQEKSCLGVKFFSVSMKNHCSPNGNMHMLCLMSWTVKIRLAGNFQHSVGSPQTSQETLNASQSKDFNPCYCYCYNY